MRSGKPVGCELGLHTPPAKNKDPLYGSGRLYPYLDTTSEVSGTGFATPRCPTSEVSTSEVSGTRFTPDLVNI
jgi:hypothetical protein